MTLLQLVPLTVQAGIVLVVFRTALGVQPSDTTYLFYHPRHLGIMLRATPRLRWPLF